MIVLLVILDQLSKYFAFQYRPNFDVLGDFFRIYYLENTGTIFKFCIYGFSNNFMFYYCYLYEIKSTKEKL